MLFSGIKVEKIFISILIGSIIGFLKILPSLDLSLSLIRPMLDDVFRDEYGISYLWIGLSCGMSLIIVKYLFRKCNILYKTILLFFALIFILGIIISGTRAVLFILVLSPLLLFLTTKISLKVGRNIISIFMIVLLFASIFPQQISKYIKINNVNVNSKDRVISSIEMASISLSARFDDWERMLHAEDIHSILFGTDYKTSVNKAVILRHPHNILVWCQIVGGLIVNFILVLILRSCLYQSFRLMKENDSFLHDYGSVCFLMFVILISIFITNSWIWGSPMIFGVCLSILNFLSCSSKEKIGLRCVCLR